MPAINTHFIHCDLVRKKIETVDFKIDKKLMLFGSIFPDIFYFGNPKISNQIHNSNVEGFYRYLIEQKDELDIKYYSFLLGALGHMYLDTTVHPYVYYKTGVYKKYDKSTYKYRSLHMQIEMQIDGYFLKEYRNIDFRKHRTYKMFNKLDKDFVNELNKTLTEYFKEDIDVEKYYNNLKKIYRRIAYDRLGIKKVLYKTVDFFFRKRKIMAHHVSQFNTGKPDLNSEKKEWCHPCTGEKYNDSFEELFRKAVSNLEDKAIELKKYYNKEVEKIDIPNNDFDTGLACSDKHEIKIFEF